MKVAPTGIEPPWPYEASSGVLNRLRRPVTGAEFIQRVRRFSRIGILTLGTRFLWHTWNHDETLKPDTPEAIGHRLTMTYAERVMALAAIYSNDHQRPDPTEVDFRLLCWELHNGSDGHIILAATIDELARRLETVGAESLLRNISGGNHREARRSNRGERDSCAARRRAGGGFLGYSTSWSERRDLPAMRMSRPLWTRRSAMAEAAALL